MIAPATKVIAIYIPLLPSEVESKKLDNILVRHGFSHQYPSNYYGKYLSVNANERAFHYFTRVSNKAGKKLNDYEQETEVVKVKDFVEANKVLKEFIANNPKAPK